MAEDTSRAVIGVSPLPPKKQFVSTPPKQTFTPLMLMKLSANMSPVPSAVEESTAESPGEKLTVTDLAANTTAWASDVVEPVLCCETASHNLVLLTVAADTPWVAGNPPTMPIARITATRLTRRGKPATGSTPQIALCFMCGIRSALLAIGGHTKLQAPKERTIMTMTMVGICPNPVNHPMTSAGLPDGVASRTSIA